MSHQEYYAENSNYASFLANQDGNFFDKYYQSLVSAPQTRTVLDVGCGTGQVVKMLESGGYSPTGLEVSAANLELAAKHTSHCREYDGRNIPYPAEHFDAVGSFNVLEHVEEPEAFISELVRVLKPGGTLVLSSPNFLRVLGFRDYHPHMRGLASKWKNARTLWKKWYQIRSGESKSGLRFDRMDPIIRENGEFKPDDDAIIATNLLEMCYHLGCNQCEILTSECTDRIVPGFIEWGLNCSPLKHLVFNAFVTARKITGNH